MESSKSLERFLGKFSNLSDYLPGSYLNLFPIKNYQQKNLKPHVVKKLEKRLRHFEAKENHRMSNGFPEFQTKVTPNLWWISSANSHCRWWWRIQGGWLVVSPRKLGKMNPFWHVFFMWVGSTTNQRSCFLVSKALAFGKVTANTHPPLKAYNKIESSRDLSA